MALALHRLGGATCRIPSWEVPLDPEDVGHEPGSRVEAGQAMDLVLAERIARALGSATEMESLEHAALALSVHPEVGGCERAWLLLWDERSGLLVARDSARAPVTAPPPAEWLDLALSSRLRLESQARALGFPPQRLGGRLAQAWNPGSCGAPGEGEGVLPWSGAAHVDAVALRRAGRPWALIVCEWSGVPEPARHSALTAVGRWCGDAGHALEQRREARRRAQQAGALAQAVQAVGSTQNLAEVLQRVARLAALATGARGSLLWVAASDGLRLEATQGAAGQRERIARALRPMALAIAEDGRARAVERASEEALLGPEGAAEVDSVVACPMRAYGRVHGVLACYDRAVAHGEEPARLTAGDMEFLGALADLAGVAVDQAERFAEARSAEQCRRGLTGQLRRQERLAWLGELATRMAREARNPLASIAAFARRVQRTLAEEDPNRECMEIILRESERLERLLGEQSDYAPESEGALGLEGLNALVQEALAGASDLLVRRRVRLVKKLAPDLPELLLDRARIRRVISNMLESALEAVGAGGRIRLESRRLGACVLLELAHDGALAPGELLDQVFVPFAGQRSGGPAVGLAVAQQIVREHGGEIRVRSDGEWASVFSLSLPVHENQDRRRKGAERRRAGGERRASAAGG